MASIERTAYPQFKRNPVVRELVAAYTPTDAELAFITDNARQQAVADGRCAGSRNGKS